MKTLEGQIDYHIQTIPTISVPESHLTHNRNMTQPKSKPIKSKKRKVSK